MKHIVARQRWRAFVVRAFSLALVLATTANAARAQVRVSWDANAAVSQFDSRTQSGTLNISPNGSRLPSRWLEQRALGAAFRYDHPFLQLNADGVFRDGDVVGNATGGMSALLSTPAWRGFRVSAGIESRHVPNDASTTYTRDTTALALWVPAPAQPLWHSNATASISFARNATGYWLQASTRSGANTSDSLSSLKVAAGVSRQLRDVIVGFSLSSQNVRLVTPARFWVGPTGRTRIDTIGNVPTTVTDSGIFGDSGSVSWRRWPEAAARIGWGRGRFALDAVINARPRNGNYQSIIWGGASGTAAINSRMAFIGGIRSTAPLPGVMGEARRIATFGMRVAPPAFWRPSAPATVRANSRSFDVLPIAPGQFVFVLTVPNARTVELAGDFTGWESVALRQVNATRWEVVLTVAPGSHRCNVRIDGAEWVPPPGVPSVKDEFNGRVGLFVAE